MKFISEDGKVFETVEACEAHEKELQAKADAQKALLLQQAKDLKELNDAKRRYEELLKVFKEKYRPEENEEPSHDEPVKHSKRLDVQFFFGDGEEEDDDFEEDFEDDCDEDDCDEDDCDGCCGDGDCDACDFHGHCPNDEVNEAMNELASLFERIFG